MPARSPSCGVRLRECTGAVYGGGQRGAACGGTVLVTRLLGPLARFHSFCQAVDSACSLPDGRSEAGCWRSARAGHGRGCRPPHPTHSALSATAGPRPSPGGPQGQQAGQVKAGQYGAGAACILLDGCRCCGVQHLLLVAPKPSAPRRTHLGQRALPLPCRSQQTDIAFLHPHCDPEVYSKPCKRRRARSAACLGLRRPRQEVAGPRAAPSAPWARPRGSSSVRKLLRPRQSKKWPHRRARRAAVAPRPRPLSPRASPPASGRAWGGSHRRSSCPRAISCS